MLRGPTVRAPIILLLALLAGCAEHGVLVRGDPPPPRGGVESVSIPKGHYPPPGKCRIWYPERPPGQQPPPGECAELQHRVPPGAALVRG